MQIIKHILQYSASSRANKPIYLIKLKFIALQRAVARQTDQTDRQTDTIHAKWFINSRPSIMRGRGSYLAFIPRNASSLWRCRTEQNGDRAKVKDLVHAEPPIPLLQLQVDCK